MCNFPQGARYDKTAPYNQPEVPTLSFEVSATYTITKTDDLLTDCYDVSGDEFTCDREQWEDVKGSPVKLMEVAADFLAEYRDILHKNGEGYKKRVINDLIDCLRGWSVDDCDIDSETKYAGSRQ